jgi:hypothetical protein
MLSCNKKECIRLGMSQIIRLDYLHYLFSLFNDLASMIIDSQFLSKNFSTICFDGLIALFFDFIMLF